VATGNFSRIGVARVQFDQEGLPTGVERLGVALEPTMPYERNKLTGGGCEDARITYVPALSAYLMTYVAYGSRGPRIALALSQDLLSWERRGLVSFAPLQGVDMNRYNNKDALIFPDPVSSPDGRPAIALLHRPMYGKWGSSAAHAMDDAELPPGVTDSRWTMWLSYCPLDEVDWATPGIKTAGRPPAFANHHLLLAPQHPWESLRLGGGTPPIRLANGWFTIYHGIAMATRLDGSNGLCYSAGALVLDYRYPQQVLYRSAEPTLAPLLLEERSGVVSDVVFPTAVDQHETYVDVYYGMADACIGAARMAIPVTTPPLTC